MSKLVTIVEEAIRPFEVLETLNITIKEDKYGNYNVTDPLTKGKTCRLEGGSVVSNYPYSKFQTGSIIDYVAYIEGSYNKAVNKLSPFIRKELEETLQSPWELIAPNIEGDCKKKRRVLKFLLELRDNSSMSRVSTQAKGKAKTLGVDVESNPNSCFLCCGHEINDFLELVTDYTETTVSKKPTGAYLVFPYFSKFHTIGTLFILDIKTGECSQVACEPAKFMYYGVLDKLPFVKETYLCKSFLLASKYNSYFREMSPEVHCFGVIADLERSDSHIHTEDALYLHDPNQPLTMPSLLDKEYGGIRLAHKEEGVYKKNSMWFKDYFNVTIWTMLQASGCVTSSIKKVIQEAAPSPEQVDSLKEYLLIKKMGRFNDLLFSDNSNAPTYIVNNELIVETIEGYAIQYPNTGAKELVTNFTLTFDSNVSFQDSGDVFHSGSLVFGGITYPMLLESKHLENTKEIEKQARATEMQGANITSSTSIPFVFNHKKAKNLPTILLHKVKSLPRAEGVSTLGWQKDNKSFVSPYWTVSEDGSVLYTAKVPHPRVIHFKNYDFTPHTTKVVARDYNKLGVEIKDAVAMIVALIARSYMDYPVGPVFYKNTGHTKNVLEALFRGLGQTSAISVTGGIRSAAFFSGLHKIPFLIAGVEESGASRIKLPMFVLTSNGFSISTIKRPEAIPALAPCMENIVRAVVTWLMASNAEDYETVTSPSYEVDLLTEGYSIIQKAYSSRSLIYQKDTVDVTTTSLDDTEDPSLTNNL